MTMLVVCILALVAFSQAQDELILSAFKAKIVGGEEVPPHSIPYQAFLIVRNVNGPEWCGGSLISPEWVLSAAHCFEMPNITLVKVGLGVHNLWKNETTRNVQNITRYIIHENYNRPIAANDIAVVQLPNPITPNEYIKIINLPKKSDTNTYVNALATASGWGDEVYNATVSSDVLRAVNLTVITNSECGTYYGKTRILNSMLCTSSKDKKASCQGDSGGPLTVGEGTDLQQIGVISFGFQCAKWPGVDTRVTSFLSWINIQTGIVIRP